MRGRRSIRIHRALPALVLAAGLGAAASSSCATKANYLDPEGPRFAGDHTSRTQAVTLTVSDPRTSGETGLRVPAGPAPAASFGETLKVVSYNVRYGEEIDAAIEVLTGTPELADADVYLLQEMNAPGVERIARALGCGYVYYPASLRTSGRDFGNAVLTRGRIAEDQKVLLPHLNPFNRQQRIAVRTELELGPRALQAYSVHTETPYLPLGDRLEQIDALLDSVSDPGPCLVAGDFNTMREGSLLGFERAFSERGFQRASDSVGPTFGFGPFRYAMDHVFVRGLEVVGAGKVEDADASDHVPIWVELAWSAVGGS